MDRRSYLCLGREGGIVYVNRADSLLRGSNTAAGPEKGLAVTVDFIPPAALGTETTQVIFSCAATLYTTLCFYFFIFFFEVPFL